jgi:hypothetical protein
VRQEGGINVNANAYHRSQSSKTDGPSMYSVIDSYNVDKNIIISTLGVVAFKPKVANEDRNAKEKNTAGQEITWVQKENALRPRGNTPP